MTTKCPNCGIELSAPIRRRKEMSGRKFLAGTLLAITGSTLVITLLSRCFIFLGHLIC